jgi:hypothetical protein
MIITGGAGVLAILGGTYLSMVYSKRRQERNGTNPICMLSSSLSSFFSFPFPSLTRVLCIDEQVLAHVGTKPMSSSPNDDIPSLPTRSSQIRTSKQMKPPVQEHDAKHDSIEERKARSDGNDFDQIRREQPAPQREKGDGSGKLVSQSTSDYMKGKGK